MGQDSKPVARQLNMANELKLVDQKQGLYINLCNQRYYTKTDLFMQDIADIEYELQVFKFRRINEKVVVSVDYCENTIEREVCSTFASFIYFIEKIQCTLFQKSTIQAEQGVALIIQALNGFHVLYEHFGYFTPSSKMVCFDKTNNLKVWMNQDFRITKNLKFPHYPKSAELQNKLIRQITRLFDYLRDPFQPLFRFSDNLPISLLTFEIALNFYHQRLKQMSIKRLSQPKILKQAYKNSLNSQINRPIAVRIISQQATPVVSPCKIVPHIFIQNKSPQRQIVVNYLSPRMSAQPNLQQFKEAVSTSLKNNTNTGRVNQICNASKEVSSTMPASLKNSGFHDKNYLTAQIHNPLTFKGSQIKPGEIESAALRKHAAQRYSEIEPTSFGKNISPKTIILQQESIVKIENISKQSYQQSSKSNKGVFESVIDQNRSKMQYQSHKRHRTDLKLKDVKSQISSNVIQKSAVEGSLMSKFNINTIKSIHLLEEDREADTDIIVDLKHLINKYRQKS